jgi:plastocyanin
MRAPRSGIVAMALLLSVGAGACSSSKKASSSSTSSATIDIKTFKFQPSPDHVKVGQTITVTNLDNTDHSLTANNGSFDTGVFSTGSKTFTISKAGTYTIRCRIHNFMTGTIVAS